MPEARGDAHALTVPTPSLVVLVGPSGSGKSTFAARHFRATEVISSDRLRAAVCDDENDLSATPDAFEVLGLVVRKRLARGRLTVVDATNVQPEARRPLVALAREHHVFAVAIVLDVGESTCNERNGTRTDRDVPRRVVRSQCEQLRRSLRHLQREGFRYVHVLGSPEDVASATVVRQRLWTDRRDDEGPFDVIGDVHGCFDELVLLLRALGWTVDPERFEASHPAGRKAVFLGDLVDRGPASPQVLRLVMAMVERGTALCVPGNHEQKLLRKLRGADVRTAHGLQQTLDQLDAEPPDFRERVAAFIDGLVSHYVLDRGRLVVAHAGLPEPMHGRSSMAVREFALYGDTTGETDEYGLPVRYPWAKDYRGQAAVAYGHVPVPSAEWLNGTICLDTGCVFGGRLTALRWPEREIVSVPAIREHYPPVRPLAAATPATRTLQQEHDELLDIEDVMGKRVIETRLQHRVTVREENALAALEVMSRFAADPRWIVYLPPTMSPCETSRRDGLLEHPDEAFDWYRRHGVARVSCQEKHMGSRAVIVACRDESVAARRFGVSGAGAGACLTRTGRPFFEDAGLEGALLAEVRAALDAAGTWEDLATDWVLLDAELMPWSLKAQSLLREQYGAVGEAAVAALGAASKAFEAAAARGVDAGDAARRASERLRAAQAFDAAWQRYCWPVGSIEDVRLAPFHVLASEGGVHVDRDHGWHLDVIGRACRSSRILQATRTVVVDLEDDGSRTAGISWWEELTAAGGEGMVVKPLEFLAHGRRGLLQPAMKVRGREYLRLVYGPEYDLPENLERLRERSLGHKRSLALRELALGIEGLKRFVRREPLRRVHECAFAVLALESEPVDPRL